MKLLIPVLAVAACIVLASFAEACDRGQLRSQLCDDYGSQQFRRQVVTEYVPVQREVVVREYRAAIVDDCYEPQQFRRSEVRVERQRSQRVRLFQGRNKSRSRSRQVQVESY